MVSVVEGPVLEGVEDSLELGSSGGTTSLQDRAELPEAGMGMLERLCVARGWLGGHKLPGAAGGESSGAAITSKGVSTFPQQTAAFQSRALPSP